MAKKHSIAQAKYDSTHCRTYNLKLNIGTDSDIIAKLDNVESKQGYIKQLIRDDITRTCSVPKTESTGYSAAIKNLAQNWIDNADTTPVPEIDIETAEQYISWMDPDTNLPEGLTPEAFMEAWNDIIRT